MDIFKRRELLGPFYAKIMERLAESKCPICGGQEWEVTGDVYELLNTSNTKAVPCLPVVCKDPDCGYVLWFAPSNLVAVVSEYVDGTSD